MTNKQEQVWGVKLYNLRHQGGLNEAALARHDRLEVEAAHVEALAEEAKLKVQRTLFMLCDFDVETYQKRYGKA